MISDAYIIKVEIKEGFDQEIKDIMKLQAARKDARVLVSTFVVKNEIVLIFEIA